MVSGAAGSRRGDAGRCMSGTLDAKLEAQRTIKRAELTACLCLPRKPSVRQWFTLVRKGSSMGCGAEKCIVLVRKHNDADLDRSLGEN